MGNGAPNFMRSKESGFTLAELTIVVAVMLILSVIVARLISKVTESQHKSTASLTMRLESQRILSFMTTYLSQAGDRVPNLSDQGKSVIADHGNAPDGTPLSDIIFFYRDDGQLLSEMDPDDHWMRYRLENDQIFQEIYKTDSSTNIIAGLVPVEKSRPFTMPSGVRVKTLEFVLYTSKNDAVDVGYIASQVRIRLVLEKASHPPIPFEREEWVLLRGVLAARQM